MQGCGISNIEEEENQKAYQKKLPIWTRQTESDNFANFPLLNNCVSKIENASETGDNSIYTRATEASNCHELT